MMRDLYSDQTNTTHTKKGFFSFFDLIFVILFINQSEFFFQKRNVVKRMLTRTCKGRHQGCKEANDTDVSRILNNWLWRTRRCTKYENHAKVLKNLLNISFYQLTSKYLLHSTFQLSKNTARGLQSSIYNWMILPNIFVNVTPKYFRDGKVVKKNLSLLRVIRKPNNLEAQYF